MSLSRAVVVAAVVVMFAFGCASPPRFFDANIEAGEDTGGEAGNLDAAVDGTLLDAPVDRGARCPGNGTEITGTVLTPNGEDPVPGAVVYAVRGSPPAINPGVACDTCELPPDTLGFMQTGIDGVFSIPHVVDEGGTVNIVLQKGRFRRVIPVTFPACTPLALSSAQSRLPGRRIDGDMPRILIASGSGTDVVLDNIARVIDRVGVTDFDRVAPCRTAVDGANLTAATCELGALLADRTRLSQYNIVFAPCGSLGFAHSWQILGEPQNAAIVTNVREFLDRGGRLYTSDTAYGLLERVYPEAVEFAGGTTLADRGRDPASVGYGGSPTNPREYAGHANDPELTMWLRGRNALATDGSVPLTGFISPWAAVASVPPTTKVWINGTVQWFPLIGTAPTEAGDRPLAITAEYRGSGRGCGRVMFTSYEVDSRAMTTLTPQERVLEWLLFELGGCVAPPG